MSNNCYANCCLRRIILAFFTILPCIFASSPLQAQTTVEPALPIPTLMPEQIAEQGVDRNTEWKPYFQEFDGFEMALVPVGCFIMGSDDADQDERPENQQCFDEPFWIDRTEVTNQHYGSSGIFAGDNRPRDSVTWNEAQEFCLNRDSRLPTEAEWQYAARGPDSLTYPWGNRFIEDNVVYGFTANDQTAEVHSRVEGVSWVGALHMSGNVWEWMSTIYRDYPYSATDGREDEQDTTSDRVILGGSWSLNADNVRVAERYYYPPDTRMNDVGFRCLRDYSKG